MAKEAPKCAKHDCELTYSKELKRYFCKECLHAAYLTDLAQKEAVKRYQQTDKFKASQKKYAEGKGKTARQRYLSSDKYKARRKEYNERLKESLAIARQAQLERPSVVTEVELVRSEVLAPLTQDIREFLDTMGRLPSAIDVQEWSRDVYSTPLTREKAVNIINQASKRR